MTIKPASCLPWEDYPGNMITDMRGGRVATDVSAADAAYTIHAANAYPKLVAALRETAARLRGAAYDARQGVSQRSGNPIEVMSERADEWEREAQAADALLNELGETS